MQTLTPEQWAKHRGALLSMLEQVDSTFASTKSEGEQIQGLVCLALISSALLKQLEISVEDFIADIKDPDKLRVIARSKGLTLSNANFDINQPLGELEKTLKKEAENAGTDTGKPTDPRK